MMAGTLTPEPNESREAWEDRVIEAADYFVVITFPGRNRLEFESLYEAMEIAIHQRRALVYAVAASGRSVLVPRDKWPKV
jgi:hypothetical protein